MGFLCAGRAWLRLQVEAYLNRRDVQQAIHANLKLPWRWTDCTDVLQYSEFDYLTSVVPLYQQLHARTNGTGFRFMLFSGDVDNVCPTPGTMQWLHNMGLPVTSQFRTWELNGNVGGRVAVYDNSITFATVRFAGHMVRWAWPGLIDCCWEVRSGAAAFCG